jgi:ABC-type transport system substrate-binding protein
MTSPEGEWGSDPAYQDRPYDPDKAKQLLAEAGCGSGCEPRLMDLETGRMRHCNYYKEGFIRWRTADDWMEKH